MWGILKTNSLVNVWLAGGFSGFCCRVSRLKVLLIP